MKTEAYTVKLGAETKEKWLELVKGLMEERNLATMGEVYPVIIDIITSDAGSTSPDLNGFISAIRGNLDAVMKNVLAIDGVFKNAVEGNEQALEQARASLVSQLEREIESKKAMEAEMEDIKRELAQAKNALNLQREENERLKASQELQIKINQEAQERILDLLSEMRDERDRRENV